MTPGRIDDQAGADPRCFVKNRNAAVTHTGKKPRVKTVAIDAPRVTKRIENEVVFVRYPRAPARGNPRAARKSLTFEVGKHAQLAEHRDAVRRQCLIPRRIRTRW